ncbi:hypothetical protein F5H01DRAFT_396130 [Linnemannia elongata]|nr:hypothetical protein F5H01DRAFT_396130 [Linnemannia elongata]
MTRKVLSFLSLFIPHPFPLPSSIPTTMLLAALPVELWDQIILNLDDSDFLNLARLNKEESGRWTPYLYHTLSITDEKRDKALASDHGQAGLKRNTQHIKTVYVRSQKALILDVLESLDTRLDLNTLFVRWQYYKDRIINLNPLIRLLEHSRNLCHLTVANIIHEPVESLLMTIARCLPRLQSLNLFKDNEPVVRPIIIREFLETCSSELETLTLGVSCSSNANTIKEDLAAMALAGPVKGSRTHPKLKCFHFAEDDWMDTSNSILPAILTTFLEGCPNLEIVDYWMFWQGNRTPWIFKHEAIIDIVRRTLGVHVLARFLNSEEINNVQLDRVLAKAISKLGVQGNTGMQEIWQSIDLEVCPPWPSMLETSRAIAETPGQLLRVCKHKPGTNESVILDPALEFSRLRPHVDRMYTSCGMSKNCLPDGSMVWAVIARSSYEEAVESFWSDNGQKQEVALGRSIDQTEFSGPLFVFIAIVMVVMQTYT